MIYLDEETISDEKVKELDAEYTSWGDTVHYSDNPKVFRGCEGSYMYDSKDVPYLEKDVLQPMIEIQVTGANSSDEEKFIMELQKLDSILQKNEIFEYNKTHYSKIEDNIINEETTKNKSIKRNISKNFRFKKKKDEDEYN